MLYYLDTNIIILSLEGGAVDALRAKTHLATLATAGYRFGISHLVRTECLVYPLKTGNGALLLAYEEFFVGPLLVTVPMNASIHNRAAMIRAKYNYGIADALHLAAAIEHRFDRFLTNDQQLAGFTEIPVELLP